MAAFKFNAVSNDVSSFTLKRTQCISVMYFTC